MGNLEDAHTQFGITSRETNPLAGLKVRWLLSVHICHVYCASHGLSESSQVSLKSRTIEKNLEKYVCVSLYICIYIHTFTYIFIYIAL